MEGFFCSSACLPSTYYILRFCLSYIWTCIYIYTHVEVSVEYIGNESLKIMRPCLMPDDFSTYTPSANCNITITALYGIRWSS